MNEGQLEDLKQFIDARISQSEARFDARLNKEIGTLRQEMLEGFAAVGETLEIVIKQFDERITKIEQKLA